MESIRFGRQVHPGGQSEVSEDERVRRSDASTQVWADECREKKRENNDFDLVATVHASERASLKPEIEPEHIFEVTLESDKFTEEKFALFDNYQRHVHHEKDHEISRGGFKRFLCSSPLHRHTSDGKPLGSFHQMYRLDGRLIAMSVLDLLPHAVSGVYFIYHSDFEKWSFGKLSALREAALAAEKGYEWLYMGYCKYIDEHKALSGVSSCHWSLHHPIWLDERTRDS